MKRSGEEGSKKRVGWSPPAASPTRRIERSVINRCSATTSPKRPVREEQRREGSTLAAGSLFVLLFFLCAISVLPSSSVADTRPVPVAARARWGAATAEGTPRGLENAGRRRRERVPAFLLFAQERSQASPPTPFFVVTDRSPRQESL